MILSSPTTQLCPIWTRLSDLRVALHAGLTHGCAIDRGEALDFDIVLDHGDTGLHDLVVRAVGAFGKPVAIATDDDVILQNDAVPDLAKFAYDRMRVSGKIIADYRS